MSVVPPAVPHLRLALLILIAVSAGCAVPEPEQNRYQVESVASSVAAGPVTELQNQALTALNEDSYQQAINYLQRAIKIQPRNAWSWHYLAQIYWRSGDSDRCLAMIERSHSYGDGDDDLEDANDQLKVQCQQG